MKRFLQSGVVIAAGILGVAGLAAAHTAQDVSKTRKKFDLREAVLRRFLKDHQCPAESFAGVFVAEADAHGLDWRLLPSLAYVETGAGKQSKYNNLFGWANGKTRFDSIGDAIHDVATGLSDGRSYKGKDLIGKLRAYNRNLGYRDKVMGVMESIAPSPLPEPAE